MNLNIRGCKSTELTGVIEHLDREFVLNKQRSVSLSQRFPNTLALDNLEQIRVAVLDGVLCGAVSMRRFEWFAEEHAWHGAMVGMVWVDSQHRRKGIGSKLLSSVTELLHEREMDFGILWTGNPSFYERAGWILHGRGLFGQAGNRKVSQGLDTVSCRPLASVDVGWLERLRASALPMRVVRNTRDYRAIPIPAVQVLCFSVQSNDGGEGFALVGEQPGIGYFYEMVAPPSLWGAIWTAVTKRFGQLFVNGQSGDAFAQWLAQNGLVVWQPQNKTLWLRVSRRMEEDSLKAWHIPYFDWI